MAVPSDVDKYTIDGVELRVYPSSVQVSDNLVSKSWNDMYGIFHDIPVNLKTKIIWKFDALSKEDAFVIYSQIRKKITEQKTRFFEITSSFPFVSSGGTGRDFIKGTYYLGTPTTFDSLGYGGEGGSVPYWKVELHWIEVDGTKLNTPTATATQQASLFRLNGKSAAIEDVEKLP